MKDSRTQSHLAQTVKRFSHIGLGICHPYQLDDSTCHLRAARYLVSFWFYFEYNFLSANCVVLWRLILVCSVSLCRFYGTLDTYGLIQSDFIASPGITGMFFPDKSANQLQLSYFYSYFAMRKGIRHQNSYIRLVSSRGYKALPAVLSGDAFSCTIPRSAYNGLPEM